MRGAGDQGRPAGISKRLWRGRSADVAKNWSGNELSAGIADKAIYRDVRHAAGARWQIALRGSSYRCVPRFSRLRKDDHDPADFESHLRPGRLRRHNGERI